MEVSLLFDFYGELLTKRQADAIELYYNQDLSLSEISEHLNITRQGVRDSIKRGEKLLFELEQKLGIVKRFITIQKKINAAKDIVDDMEVLNRKKIFSEELKQQIDILKGIIGDIDEKV